MKFDLSGRLIVNSVPKPSALAITAVSTAGGAVTLKIPAPVQGLFIHITNLTITASDGPGVFTTAAVTTTNLPGDIAYTVGTFNNQVDRVTENYPNPLRARAQGEQVTFTCPAVTTTTWRITVAYYLEQAE